MEGTLNPFGKLRNYATSSSYFAENNTIRTALAKQSGEGRPALLFIAQVLSGTDNQPLEETAIPPLSL